MNYLYSMEPLSLPKHWATQWMVEQGVATPWLSAFTLLLDISILLAASVLADFIARRVVIGLIRRWVHRTEAKWDDYFLEEKVFQTGVHFITGIVIKGFIPVVFTEHPKTAGFLVQIASLYIVWQLILLVNKTARAMAHVLEDNPKFKDKPVRTLLQVAQFLSWILGILGMFSVLTGTALGTLVGALAGFTAILILIFQDAINGLLANFQISMYDLLKKGDWITFDKFGVDGDVVSIDLTTVKVKNFDNTLSSIPAKAFVTESFQNWRGMRLAKVRRIKRALLLDLNTIRYADDALIERMRKVERLQGYLDARQKDIEAFNASSQADKSLSINGRHMTNIGLFRAYVESYLSEHPQVSKKDILLVRQLAPTSSGIPLEIYCFVKEIRFEEYETVASDIMDHLMAAVPTFDLQLYQQPTGRDQLYFPQA
jgi:miniconductance mechanosensitive channel